MNRHVKHFFMIKEFKGSISCLLRHYNTAILVIISKLCKQNGAFLRVLLMFCFFFVLFRVKFTLYGRSSCLPVCQGLFSGTPAARPRSAGR